MVPATEQVKTEISSMEKISTCVSINVHVASQIVLKDNKNDSTRAWIHASERDTCMVYEYAESFNFFTLFHCVHLCCFYYSRLMSWFRPLVKLTDIAAQFV